MLGLISGFLLFLGVAELEAHLQADPLYAPPARIEEVRRIVGRSPSSLSEIEALLDYLFSPDHVNFQYSTRTVTVEEFLRSGRGNCLTFSLTVVILLRALGLQPVFREVDLAPVWSLQGRIVTLNEHLNVAVPVGARTYLIDLVPNVQTLEIRGRIISDDRARAHFFNNLGAAYLANSQLRAAEACFRKALEWDPTADFAWTNLGAELAFANRLREAEKAYLKALRLNPDNLAAMSNLVLVYRRMGKTAKATAYERRVREFQAKNPYHHYALALKELYENRYPAALQHLERAIELKRDEARFYFTLAKAYAHLGREEDLIDALRRAAEFATSDEERLRYEEKLARLALAAHPR
ncbi:MAG: hypothetical protein Kow00109_23660 [Acidobacteriota bacterium]